MELWRLMRSLGWRGLGWLAVFLATTGIFWAITHAVLAEASLAPATVNDGVPLLAEFAIVLAVATFSGFRVHMTLSAHVQRANARIQLRTLRGAMAAELPVIERIGAAEFIDVFSRCSGFMAAAVTPISLLTYPVAGVIGGVVVLGIEPGPMLGFFLGGFGVLLAAWASFQGLLFVRYRYALESERRASNGLSHLVLGFKEIKLAPGKGLSLQEEQIAPAVTAAAAARSAAGSVVALNYGVANAMPLFLMGITGLLVPGLFPGLAMAGAIATAVIMALPMSILSSVGDIARSNAAYREIHELESRLDRGARPASERAAPAALPLFQSMAFAGVMFNYGDSEHGPCFRVGPLSFTIPANSITFIVGGNGSGKSTILRLLTGFYQPGRGQVLLNGVRADPASSDLFGAIFADYYLFDRLYGLAGIDEGRVNALLRRFGIGEVTRYEGGRFTNLDLSTGQRKRLAMVVCLLDDKPVLVLDEWAADQDAGFRAMYYRQLLPQLKADGKTIIAVSHDDRYFDVADQVIKLEYGRIVAAPSTDDRDLPVCRSLALGEMIDA